MLIRAPAASATSGAAANRRSASAWAGWSARACGSRDTPQSIMTCLKSAAGRPSREHTSAALEWMKLLYSHAV